jgi:hypothetical protein
MFRFGSKRNVVHESRGVRPDRARDIAIFQTEKIYVYGIRALKPVEQIATFPGPKA